MLDFLSAHQLNIMLILSSACATIVIFVLMTKALPKRRRRALLLLELSCMFLLSSDRLAYIYAGDESSTGYIMVRVTNFLVFAMTLVVVLALNLYLCDLLREEGKMPKLPKRLRITEILSYIGIVMVILSQFTGMYYSFDEHNHYQRGPLFILCYVLPFIAMLVQFTVIIQYRKRLSLAIRVSLLLFILVPAGASIAQIFAYGLSLTNISIVCVAIPVYILALIDLNKRIEHANSVEIEFLQEERRSMQRLFEQTASAFVNAVDAKDTYTTGHSARVAEYARKIAKASGKNDKACSEIYYGALLYDVGKIGIPDVILQKEDNLTEEETNILRQKPVIGDRILSSISEYPYLREAAHYAHERYDGRGYPDHLKGDEIPEIARIVAVADYYDTMTSQQRDRAPFPQITVREELVKNAGTRFDPRFVRIMLTLMDSDKDYLMQSGGMDPAAARETDLECGEYRSRISAGYLIERTPSTIRMHCTATEVPQGGFSLPSLVVFDSFDGLVHDEEKTISAFHYLEYGEIWFDGHIVCTGARNMEVHVEELAEAPASEDYEINTARTSDHARIRITGGGKRIEVIIALPDSSKYAYIGLTGEHCRISGIEAESGEQEIGENDIPRIAQKLTYTDRLEGDLPNLQIDGTRSAATDGIPVKDGMRIEFHTMSLPSANLVWHCPYIVLFYADDKQVYGANYHEYALVKLNGENETEHSFADNKLTVTQDGSFSDWEDWKTLNKKGLDCALAFRRRGNTIVLSATGGGLTLLNTTTLSEKPPEVYAALTGDQCALTDIRII